jgi:hypothetical protein
VQGLFITGLFAQLVFNIGIVFVMSADESSLVIDSFETPSPCHLILFNYLPSHDLFVLVFLGFHDIQRGHELLHRATINR